MNNEKQLNPCPYVSVLDMESYGKSSDSLQPYCVCEERRAMV